VPEDLAEAEAAHIVLVVSYTQGCCVAHDVAVQIRQVLHAFVAILAAGEAVWEVESAPQCTGWCALTRQENSSSSAMTNVHAAWTCNDTQASCSMCALVVGRVRPCVEYLLLCSVSDTLPPAIAAAAAVAGA
jgi:hypothetical protein